MEKNITLEARRIIGLHAAGFMHATTYKPKTNMELWETMVDECAGILTGELLDGHLTPMEFNSVRNEITEILSALFEPVCANETHLEVRRV